MTQRTSYPSPDSRLHVGIIMDGNGRWATSRGLARVEGHRAGVKAVRRTIEAALRLGVETLTLFAFSADNWERPQGEVSALMRHFEDFLNSDRDGWAARGIELNVVGRRDRLPHSLLAAIDAAEALTFGGTAMRLRIAIDYSGRDAIVQAARRLNGTSDATRQTFADLLAEVMHARGPSSDVDLLIRTGGEQRLSDLPLWEIAYAELYFARVMWPDFGAGHFEAALLEFYSRERRFGRITEVAAS